MSASWRPPPFRTSVIHRRTAIRSWLARLCDSLGASMILEGQPLSIRVEAGAGTMTSEQAVTMGLITTELVINALKHAFPSGSTGAIVVRYASEAGAWRLSVSDDGVGMASVLSVRVPKSGLGTSIVEALTRQLGGRVVIAAALPGVDRVGDGSRGRRDARTSS
jgi:two-component system, sensor histidine kinase PdtaS